jgi:hypothetical protein
MGDARKEGTVQPLMPKKIENRVGAAVQGCWYNRGTQPGGVAGVFA